MRGRLAHTRWPHPRAYELPVREFAPGSNGRLPIEAVALIMGMSGKVRIPTLIKATDRLCRGA